MEKYWVSHDLNQFCILEEGFDSIGGNFYNPVASGISTEKEAIELCELMNKVYKIGLNDGKAL